MKIQGYDIIKVCSRCKQEKPLTKFYNRRDRRHGKGKQSMCKICQYEYGEKYRTPENLKHWSRLQYQRLKANPGKYKLWRENISRYNNKRRYTLICERCSQEFQNLNKKVRFCTKKCMATGEGNSRWKGGRRKHGYGYILIYMPNHPAANKNYVLEHRVVMEKHIGRYLYSHEIVHHINFNPTDNRIENLMLFKSRKAHMDYHREIGKDECGNSIKESPSDDYITGFKGANSAFV